MAASDDTAYLSDLVRSADRARYCATLFAPEAARPDLFALYGFATEIERVPDLVSDPNLGEIRLQWWRDSLDSALAGDGASVPALRGIVEAIRRHSLPVPAFHALIDARRADLYSDPPADRTELEGLLGETQSAVFQLAALILGSAGPETADASGHAGIAYGIARRLAAFPAERARGRLVIPGDVLAANGMSAPEALAMPPPARLSDAIAATADIGREHLRLTRGKPRAWPRETLPAYLPLAVAAPLLNRLAPISDLETLARIVWARLRS